MNKLIKNSLYFFIPFIIDRLTKSWAVNTLTFQTIPINKLLTFELLYNKGLSWGIFHSQNLYVNIGVSLFIFLVMIYLLDFTRTAFNNNQTIFSLLLILSGGFSNLIDRVIYAGVVDFIVIHYNSWYFPTFNIADVAIEVGALIFIIQGIRGKWDLKQSVKI